MLAATPPALQQHRPALPLTVRYLTSAGPLRPVSNPPPTLRWEGAEGETGPHLSVGTSQAREGGRGPQAREAWVWQGRAGLPVGLRAACWPISPALIHPAVRRANKTAYFFSNCVPIPSLGQAQGAHRPLGDRVQDGREGTPEAVEQGLGACIPQEGLGWDWRGVGGYGVKGEGSPGTLGQGRAQQWWVDGWRAHVGPRASTGMVPQVYPRPAYLYGELVPLQQLHLGLQLSDVSG